MTWSGGEDGRRDSRSPSQPGGTLRPSELWAACVAFTGKGAAIPGGKTRVCLTCSWRRLSSWEKQEHHGLWSRLLWMNPRGGRGQDKGILRAEKTGRSWCCWFLGDADDHHGRTVSFGQMQSKFEQFPSQHFASGSVAVPQYWEWVSPCDPFQEFHLTGLVTRDLVAALWLYVLWVCCIFHWLLEFSANRGAVSNGTTTMRLLEQ